MCETLSELQRAFADYAARFDAALVTLDQAQQVVALAADGEDGGRPSGTAAARAADTGARRRHGHRSPAHYLARRTGRSVAEAAQALETARRLDQLPQASAAARRGELSAAQSSAIADAAGADPAAEGRLVQEASSSSLAELREACARTKAAAGSTWRPAAAGCTPSDPLEAYPADALTESVCGGGNEPGTPRRLGTKILVRVDLGALLRGCPTDGEVCEIAGYGPVTASVVRDMIDSGVPFLAAVVTRGVEVLGVAHLGRRPTAAQQTALPWLYPPAPGRAAEPWPAWSSTTAATGPPPTSPCSSRSSASVPHDHHFKTREGWALVAGRGTRRWSHPTTPAIRPTGPERRGRAPARSRARSKRELPVRSAQPRQVSQTGAGRLNE